MSLPQYSGVTVDVLTNQALPGATVAVREAGTQTLMVLWADAGEVTPSRTPSRQTPTPASSPSSSRRAPTTSP